MDQEQLNLSIKNAEYQHSFFGSICRIFGVIGVAVSIFLTYEALKAFYNHENNNLLLISLTPAGSVAATSAALGALGTTAKQSKVQSYYLKTLLENSSLRTEVYKETIDDQILEEK